MATNKRKNISIQEKVDIIHELERGDTNSQVFKKYSKTYRDIKLSSMKQTSILNYINK